MRKSRFTEAQIIGMIKAQELCRTAAGGRREPFLSLTPIAGISTCRTHGKAAAMG